MKGKFIKNIIPSRKVHSVKDARNLARKKLPKLVFDFVDGASGDEKLSETNSLALDQLRLLPRVLINVENRSFKKNFLGFDFNYPFGFAPMGMCNLTWPGADFMLSHQSIRNNIPLCLSMAASSTLEEVYKKTEGRSWLQIYIGQDEEFVIDILDRAKNVGYKVIILTVDVPVLSRRVRDEKNGWNVPFKMGLKQFFDFALHPHWSLSTLINGAPKPMNYQTSDTGKRFIRGESRGATDWDTLKRIRNIWKHKLIVKGVMSAEDALKIKSHGVDAVYVSNHGGRQLDSAPIAIKSLENIRKEVGEQYPLIFDSGIRTGGDIVRALALGADYVMIGRPLMYAIGADGEQGLQRIVEIIKEELSTTLGLVGLNDINDISSKIIDKENLEKVVY